ncbi:hypothetical protein BC938DRAFT_476135 [Jimgerdemannia flammicorona]|uniref:FAD dependent oxidoreductase domain-containing protein n=1 Tax=Jimgerdemannia flammicorona TaxID=994334 RepID=A0A433QQW8_9FUNG|nr:hypothetical protein BC938DRAFT_476135 [Jimgerdemannia flammicorona]
MTDPLTQPRHVVICGGGIVGVCIAYFLAEKDPSIRITVIERTAVACAASGVAGGFLACNCLKEGEGSRRGGPGQVGCWGKKREDYAKYLQKN